MKKIEVTDSAALLVENLRCNEASAKSEIADSFSILADMLMVSRNDEEGDLASFSDSIVNVMSTLSSYNHAVNSLSDTKESPKNRILVVKERLI